MMPTEPVNLSQVKPGTIAAIRERTRAMHQDRSGFGTPFRDKRTSRALRDEDSFMQAHGGRGARAMYLAVSWIEAGLVAAGRMPALFVMHLNRRPKSRGKRQFSVRTEAARHLHEVE